MKLLFTADIHVHPTHLDGLLRAAENLEPDGVVIGGDLIPDWKGSIEDSIEPHRRWVKQILIPRVRDFHKRFPDVPVLLDFGNDDIAAARSLLMELDGQELFLIDMKVLEIEPGLALAGYMWVNPTPFLIKDREKPDCRDFHGFLQADTRRGGYITAGSFVMPHQLDPLLGTMEDDLEKLSMELEKDMWKGCRFIFVSHAPPRNTALDCLSSGAHVGSLAVRRFIERWSSTGRLLASLHGHIHESPWQSQSIWEDINGVACFNIGQKSTSLRILVADTNDMVGSARLFVVRKAGGIEELERRQWCL